MADGQGGPRFIPARQMGGRKNTDMTREQLRRHKWLFIRDLAVSAAAACLLAVGLW